MKRTLLGLTALTSVVGTGSVGVFYAHRIFVPAATAQSEPQALASEMNPVPIPLAADSTPSAAADAMPAAAPPIDNRYANYPSPIQSPPVDDTASVEEAPAAVEEAPPAREGDPFARRRVAAREDRYPERTASAEMAAEPAAEETPDEVAAADNQDEPQPLADPQGGSVDRFGRRIPAAGADPRRREQPSEDSRFDRRGGGDVAQDTAPPDDGNADTDNRATEDPVVDTQPATEEQPMSDQGTGRPGDPQLSGSQAPTLTIEKTAPPEIQIGKPAKFVIKVRNAGSVVAHGVEIHDTIPQGTQLIETTPPAERGRQGTLMWELGTLKPGEEKRAEVQLMPQAEGEIGSVATVTFRAEASVRTLATKPMLNIEVVGPDRVMKGSEVVLRIKISNPGSGAATGVVLSETVPTGLSHPSGNELELEIGTLRPGETRQLELGLAATEAGTVTNVVTAQGEGKLQAQARADVEIVAPQLQVNLAGPKRRYLERNATHTITIANPGTAPAKNIELMAVLPKHLKFVEANNGGQFDAATHAVYWGLEELPPQESGTVSLTTLPIEAGDARVVIKATAEAGLKDQREEVVSVEGLSAINFQVTDTTGPIEVGGQATYEIRVMNQGSKAAGNVRVVALVPRELKAVSADGPVRYKIEGGRVMFEPLKQLAAKGDATFTIKAQGLEPGDLRVQVQITSDEIREPITKEEGTRVYGSE